MKGFGFSLADGASLVEDASGYYLLSRLPIRILRLNRALHRLLNHIQRAASLPISLMKTPALRMGSCCGRCFRWWPGAT
ncbi:MAG: hypothetical protein ABID71_02485 [Chloroflexota bacterium]